MIKYTNTYILTILAPKSELLLPYHHTLVMNCKIYIFFTFPIVPCIMCCLSVSFMWFRKFYCVEILIKHQNTYIMTNLAPKYDILLSYPLHESQTIIFFFTFPIVPYILCCLNVIFVWFCKFYCVEMLIKHQNTNILTNLAPKCDILLSYPGHELQNIIFFYFSNISIYIALLKVSICVL